MFENAKLLMFIEALLITGMLLFRFCQRPSTRGAIKPLYIGAVLATPAIGLFVGTYHLFYMFLLLLPFAAGRNRLRLACLYMAVLLQFPELSQAYVIGPIYIGSASAIDIFNLGTLLALLAVRGRDGRRLGAFDVCAWGLYFLILFSQARGYELTVVGRLTHFWFLTFMPPYLLLSRTIRSREEAEEVMMVFVWSAVMCAVVATFESVRGWPLYQAIGYSLHVPAAGQGLSATLSVRSGFLRAQGPIANPSALGIIMGMGLLFAAGLKRRFNRPQIWAIFGILTVGLIVSQSRGAWIATALGYMVYLYMQRRFGLVGTIAPLGLAAWAATQIVSKEGQLGQLLGKSGQGEFTAQYRSNLLTRGIEEMGKHPFGQSPTQLQISMNDMRQGEHIIDFVNSHLYIGLVAGIAGLALWLALWSYPIIAGMRARSSRRGQRERIPLEMPVGALVTCFVALLFTSPVDRNATLVALSLGLIAALVRGTRRRGPVVHPRPGIARVEHSRMELVSA